MHHLYPSKKPSRPHHPFVVNPKPMTNDWFHSLISAGQTACNTTALSAAVYTATEAKHVSAIGVTENTPFDVASLTKILCTTASLYHLVSHGAVSFDDPIAKYLPQFAQNGKSQVTIRAVLGHRSGLPAWAPLFEAVRNAPNTRCLFDAPDQKHSKEIWACAKTLMLEQVMEVPLKHTPGTRVYSDYGFMVLGALIETVTGNRLDTWAHDTLFPLFSLPNIQFRPISDQATSLEIPPTGWTRPREPAPGQERLYEVTASKKQQCRGHVDDDNAFALNGIAGHAGLFATAADVAQFGAVLLRELDGQGQVGVAEVLQEMVSIDKGGQAPFRGLGFDHAIGPHSTAGTQMSENHSNPTFGHLGFTGCSLWVDPIRHLSVALLTNRVFPTRANVHGIKAFRPHFHDTLIAHIESF